MAEVPVLFGPYLLSRQQGLLRFKGSPVMLDAPSINILAALIESAGAPLPGAALMAGGDTQDAKRLWDSVASLNQALADLGSDAGYIEHRPSTGFSLVLPAQQPAPLQPTRPALSRRLAPIFGRAEAIARISMQLPLRRFVTIVGPGGMGKTTLALAVADVRSADYADGIFFLDLAPLTEARLLPDALAAALGMPVLAAPVDLLAYLRTRQALIILDSCEHLIGAAAALVESFLSSAPQVHVLATSREPLRAMGEWLHRLGPMQLPDRADAITAAVARAYPGVQLFIGRASASDSGFSLTDALAPTVVELCIRLDGIPLAIELAAARVALLGVRGLAAQVEDRLLLLGAERRTATRRHRTLETLLDWSYDLLSSEEQVVLRRLSVFRGNFTLQSAGVVAGDAQMRADDAMAIVLDLAAKSLVAAVAGEGAPAFRLLDTTRAYASSKLAADADQAATRRRHAVCMRDLLIDAELAWEGMTRQEWRTTYAPWVNDLRSALDWACAAGGDAQLSLELTSAAFSLADQTSLMTEYSERIDHALKLLSQLPAQPPLLEMRLRIFPAFVHQREQMDHQASATRILNALRLAEAAAEAKHQAGPLVALWGLAFQVGDYPESMRWSQQTIETASAGADPLLGLIGKRTSAQSSHFLGRHAQAGALAAEVMENAWRKIPLAYFPSPVDSRVSMRIVRARVLWMQGSPDQAAAMVEECLDFARSDSPLGLCQSLALAAVPIALWCGDTALSRRRNAQLREHATAYSFIYWQSWWKAFDEVLTLRADAPPVLPERGGALSDPFSTKLRDHLCTFDARLPSTETLSRVRAGTVGWCAPEVLRVRGEMLRTHEPAATTEAEALFHEALTIAREQGALSWELRAAVSLARLWRSTGKREAARALLGDARGRFTEGFSTADLIGADALLLELSSRESGPGD